MEIESAIRLGLLVPDADPDAPAERTVRPGLRHGDRPAGTCGRRRRRGVPAPVSVVAFGVCASTGGPYWDAPTVVPGADRLVPVSAYVPGCPPRPDALIDALLALEAVRMRVVERVGLARGARGPARPGVPLPRLPHGDRPARPRRGARPCRRPGLARARTPRHGRPRRRPAPRERRRRLPGRRVARAGDGGDVRGPLRRPSRSAAAPAAHATPALPPLRKASALAARVETPWPGAPDPSAGGRARRPQLPPGVRASWLPEAAP